MHWSYQAKERVQCAKPSSIKHRLYCVFPKTVGKWWVTCIEGAWLNRLIQFFMLLVGRFFLLADPFLQIIVMMYISVCRLWLEPMSASSTHVNLVTNENIPFKTKCHTRVKSNQAISINEWWSLLQLLKHVFICVFL